jgi:hypothetical protein
MKVEVRIGRLKALDSGEARAEPYLWPLFFKVDEGSFADVLASKITYSNLPRDIVSRRGIDPDALLQDEERSVGAFSAPGGSHGNLPQMSTGDEVKINKVWTTELREDSGLLGAGESIVGLVVVLFEEDMFPTHGRVEDAYARFVESFKKRTERAVGDAIERDAGGQLPFKFGFRAEKGGNPRTPFFPSGIEKQLAAKLKTLYKMPLLDVDDYIGTCVWVRSSAQLRIKPNATLSRIWTPTTGSTEGSWKIDMSISVRD